MVSKPQVPVRVTMSFPLMEGPISSAEEVCSGSAPYPVPHAPLMMSVPGSAPETEVNIHNAPKGRAHTPGIICTPSQ